MFTRRTAVTLALAATFALGLSPALAQDTEEDQTLDDIEQFEGFEEGATRTWTIDFESMMEETPEDPSDPFAGMSGEFAVYGMVARFDGDDTAGDAYQLLAEASDEELELSGSEDAEISREEIDDIGDEAMSMTVTSESEGTSAEVIVAREDEYLFLAASVLIGADEESTGHAKDLLTYMVEEGEEGGDTEFNEDGTSTGGLWDFFPDDDFDAVADLVPGGDEEIVPGGDEDES